MANRSVPARVLSDEDRQILTTWSRSRTLPMNQVETWFSILQRQAIQRGVFGSVRALMGAIRKFLAHWDEKKHPFVWVKTPAEVLRRPNMKVNSRAWH